MNFNRKNPSFIACRVVSLYTTYLIKKVAVQNDFAILDIKAIKDSEPIFSPPS